MDRFGRDLEIVILLMIAGGVAAGGAITGLIWWLW